MRPQGEDNDKGKGFMQRQSEEQGLGIEVRSKMRQRSVGETEGHGE
jgi:hypothetical protein